MKTQRPATAPQPSEQEFDPDTLALFETEWGKLDLSLFLGHQPLTTGTAVDVSPVPDVTDSGSAFQLPSLGDPSTNSLMDTGEKLDTFDQAMRSLEQRYLTDAASASDVVDPSATKPHFDSLQPTAKQKKNRGPRQEEDPLYIPGRKNPRRSTQRKRELMPTTPHKRIEQETATLPQDLSVGHQTSRIGEKPAVLHTSMSFDSIGTAATTSRLAMDSTPAPVHFLPREADPADARKRAAEPLPEALYLSEAPSAKKRKIVAPSAMTASTGQLSPREAKMGTRENTHRRSSHPAITKEEEEQLSQKVEIGLIKTHFQVVKDHLFKQVTLLNQAFASLARQSNANQSRMQQEIDQLRQEMLTTRGRDPQPTTSSLASASMTAFQPYVMYPLAPPPLTTPAPKFAHAIRGRDPEPLAASSLSAPLPSPSVTPKDH